MTGEEAAQIVVEHVRRTIREKTDRTISVLRSGEGESIRNPFTGKEERRRIPEHLRLISQKLAESSLNTDEAFLKAMRALFIELGASSVFHLFSGLDGEGSLCEEVQLEIRVLDGEVLPTHLHGLLFPIEP